MNIKFNTYDFLANVWEYAEAKQGNFTVRYGLMKMAKEWEWSYKVWHTDPETGHRCEVGHERGVEWSKRDAKAAIMDTLTPDLKRLALTKW